MTTRERVAAEIKAARAQSYRLAKGVLGPNDTLHSHQEVADRVLDIVRGEPKPSAWRWRCTRNHAHTGLSVTEHGRICPSCFYEANLDDDEIEGDMVGEVPLYTLEAAASHPEVRERLRQEIRRAAREWREAHPYSSAAFDLDGYLRGER